MKKCQGCGGVLGRDCYNEADCISITQSMMYQNDIGPFQEALLEAKNVILWLGQYATVDDSLVVDFSNKIDNVVAIIERLIPRERTAEEIKQDFDELPF